MTNELAELTEFAGRLSQWIETVPLDAGPNDPVLEQQFNEFALELYGLQYIENIPYRHHCNECGRRPEWVRNWREIPALSTYWFVGEAITCLPLEQGYVRVFESSGTTGEARNLHYHNALSLAIYERSAWRWFCAHMTPEVARGQTLPWQGLFLTPSPDEAPHSSLVYMLDVVRRELGLEHEVFVGRVARGGGWKLDLRKTLRVLKRACAEDKPVLALGTAFSFVYLLEALEARGLRFKLPPGSRVMETGGYKGRTRELPKRRLYAWISRRLGVPPEYIVSEYGMCELSSQAYDWVAGAPSGAGKSGGLRARRFRFPPWARALVRFPDVKRLEAFLMGKIPLDEFMRLTGDEMPVGERGLLCVIDLANVFSLLAVHTRDLAVRHEDGFELLGREPAVGERGCSLMYDTDSCFSDP
jgi:hypothetical protein